MECVTRHFSGIFKNKNTPLEIVAFDLRFFLSSTSLLLKQLRFSMHRIVKNLVQDQESDCKKCLSLNSVVLL